MNLHRLTTHNLPSIRIHDHNMMDTSSDHHSSSASQRSMPREIPIPKHGSPTSSRCGSFHGSLASTAMPPPILSLEPPGPGLPPPSYRNFRYPESFGSTPGDDSGSEGHITRRSVSTRDRGGLQASWKLSPIGSQCLNDESDFSKSHDRYSMQSEDSFDRNWREGFYKKKIDGRASPKELQSEDSLRAAMQQAVHAYDRRLVGKLNTSTSEPSSAFARHRITPPRDIRSFVAAPAPAVEVGSLPPLPSHWKPTASPRHLPTSATSSPRLIDSPPERWAHGSAGEHTRSPAKFERPTVLGFPSSLSDFRNNGDTGSLSSSHVTDNEMPASLDSRMRRSVSASLPGPGYDSYNEDDDLHMEDAPLSHVSQMNRLTLHDARTPPHQYQRVGSKRRASSPPGEDRLVCNSEHTRKGLLKDGIGSDIYHSSRRTPPLHQSIARSSPGGHSYPKHYHPSLPRSGSGSLMSASASSGTTMWSTSIGQFSPAASSLSTQTDWSPTASYVTNMDADVMQDGMYRQLPLSGLGRPSAGRRQISEISSLGRENELSLMQHNRMLICECCPKKPKKFDNRADLQLHEMEKQYSCQYCNNRFKNKNEAERHQNSLHLRKHSWSCASLAGNYEAAFHQSTHRPSHADVCGYCGKEFPIPAQWSVRIDHLTAEHKFGECNQSKKFYRADHFRQHLKHSHSGTSGKWTNVLENACMRDEIPPKPINRGSTSSGGEAGTPSADISE